MNFFMNLIFSLQDCLTPFTNLYTGNTQRFKLNTEGNTAAGDTPLDVSSDRFDLQTNYMLGKKEFVFEYLLQAKHWARFTCPILASLMLREGDCATGTNSFHHSAASPYLGHPPHTQDVS